MCSMLGSHGLLLATAMAVSAGTLILLDHFLREKYSSTTPVISRDQDSIPARQILRSCLSSGSKKKDGKKKKKVKFADDVKDLNGDGKKYREEEQQKKGSRIDTISCGMPANRVALYTGMLKDRLQRMEYSY